MTDDQMVQVLADHGLVLTDPAKAARKVSFVVARDVPKDDALELVRDLRQHGLIAQAVAGSQAAQSARIKRAITLNLAFAVLGFLLIVPTLYAMLNLITLFRAGGPHLRCLGTFVGPDSTNLAELNALLDKLPTTIAQPLRDDAMALYKAARANPAGPANSALQRLLADIRNDQLPERPTPEASAEDLRQRLDLARRSIHELS